LQTKARIAPSVNNTTAHLLLSVVGYGNDRCLPGGHVWATAMASPIILKQKSRIDSAIISRRRRRATTAVSFIVPSPSIPLCCPTAVLVRDALMSARYGACFFCFRNKWVAVVAKTLLANLMERNGTETGAGQRGGGGLAAMEWSVIPNPNHGAWAVAASSRRRPPPTIRF
jgi:hypothetical protein